METEKLYRYNSYQTTFQANIVEKYFKQDQCVLVLDQTCFYPSSGGQICDYGSIEGSIVLDVEEENGKIIHYLKQDIEAGEGEFVTGKIDWQTRLDHMQQHTGQHILSGAIMKLWQKETQSFHMGKDICTLDIPSITLDNEKIGEIEQLSNQVIYENRLIYNYYLKNNEDVINNNFRKKQEKFDQLRIIEIEDFDRTTCGGTHCARTGEVGIIKIIAWENRLDKIRISILCGFRAFRDYQQKHQLVKNLSNFFTTGIEGLEEKIMQTEQKFRELNKTYQKIERKIIEQESKLLKEKNSREDRGIFLIEKYYEEKTMENIRQLALLLAKGDRSLIIIATEKPEPALCLARSNDLDIDIKKIFNQLLEEFQGKGGGSDYQLLVKMKNSKNVKMAYQKAIKLLTIKP